MPRLARIFAVATLFACAALAGFVAPATSSHTKTSAAARPRTLAGAGVLSYSTFLGGAGDDAANAVAVDSQGRAYAAGDTSSLNFPATAGARQTQLASVTDAFVTKFAADGSSLVYSTYAGGSAADLALGLAVDSQGNAFVAGRTNSPDFPTTPGAFDTTCGVNGTCNDIAPTSVIQSDAFVFKLNPQGSDFAYSTFLGGSGTEALTPPINFPNALKMGIAVDAAGDAFVTATTTSQDFPTTNGAFQTAPGSGFVTKLNPTGTALVYSTYFPGAMPAAITLDSDANAVISGTAGDGSSAPAPLPVVKAYQPTLGGQFTFDAFAAKLNASGTSVLFSTYLGGPQGASETPRGGDDTGSGVGIDALGNVYVAGTTRSGCFPSSNPFVAPSNCPVGGSAKEFLVKFNSEGDTLLFSKKLNETTNTGGSLAVSAAGVAYAASSCNTGHDFDVCVSGVAPNGTLVFSYAFGGSSDERPVAGVVADAAGQLYVAGRTWSPDFPTSAAAFQKTFGGASDAFVAKLAPNAAEAQMDSASHAVGEAQQKVTVRVDRSGDLTSDASVDYATSDETASERSDYTAASGTLHFAPFETSKTFDAFITNDRIGPEGDETFRVTLSNATGNLSVGAKSSTVVHIIDDDTATGPNPVAPETFDTDFFVRQHYIDFLGREPDTTGYDFWRGEITNCGSDAGCAEVKRINVSAAFFLSIEFQRTGYFVYRAYKTAYGDAVSPNVAGTVPVVRFREFMPDTLKVARGIVVGQTTVWEQQLDNNKSEFALEFVNRARFLSAFPSTLTAAEFVAKLDQNAGFVLSAQEKSQLVSELGASPSDANLRASVLRKVADADALQRNEFKRAFVLMQYFGYLRRDPDAAPDSDFRGWRFWLSKLEQFNGNFVQAEMVKAFINSDEYRHRFGP